MITKAVEDVCAQRGIQIIVYLENTSIVPVLIFTINTLQVAVLIV